MTSSAPLTQWDNAAPAYTAQHPENMAWTQILFPCLQIVIEPLSIDTAYDVGCGYGALSHYLHTRGVTVTGMDGSPAMLEQARALYPDITFIQGDIEAESAPVPAASVDTIFCINVLQDIKEYQAAIRSLSAALKPGGICVIAIEHPLWTRKYVTTTGYFEEAIFESTFLGKDTPITGYHRPLTSYMSAIKEARLSVTSMLEPRPVTPDHDTVMLTRLQQAGMLDQPVFLVLILTK